MIRIYIFLLFIGTLTSCKPDYSAQQIIDLSIEKSGLEKLGAAELSFDFRGNSYIATRKNGNFKLVKEYVKDGNRFMDVLTNNGFVQYKNDSLSVLTDKKRGALRNSVNSVHYFSVLPYGLNDAAVQKKLLGLVRVHGKDYYKIQVTFQQEGGGEDYEDVFLYWINRRTFSLDYLAYKYHTDGGGVRFREVTKEHFVAGVRLVDYANYKPTSDTIDFYTIDELYASSQLKKVSEINLENINIQVMP